MSALEKPEKTEFATAVGALEEALTDWTTSPSYRAHDDGPVLDPHDADIIVKGVSKLQGEKVALEVKAITLKQELSELQGRHNELMFKIRCVAQALK